MQKTKSNTNKTFVYQFESFFLIESATDNHKFYFSDKDYISKSNIFFEKLNKDYVEVIYLNSQPSIVPSLYFEEKMIHFSGFLKDQVNIPQYKSKVA